MRYGEISPFYCIEELVANPVLDGVSVPAGTSGQKEHCLGISKLSFNSTSFCSEQELHFQIFPTTILHWLYALQSNCHCQFKNTFRLNSSYQWCQLILYIYMDPELRTEQTTNEIKQTQKHRETSWNTVKHCETCKHCKHSQDTSSQSQRQGDLWLLASSSHAPWPAQ